MTKKLYIITIEPLESRYSKQWYKFFKPQFGKFFNVEYIDGTKFSDEIKIGRFLDIVQTNIWKAEQVINMGLLFEDKKVKDGDMFFFCDAWHFGITALKYMAQLQNIKIKIYGFWHAGTYDLYDYITQAGFRKWATFDECAWFNALDGSFVSTNFHKKLILDFFNGNIPKNKLHVVGFPMNWRKETNVARDFKHFSDDLFKKDIVVFPHRLDKEKQPGKFEWLKKQLPDFTYIRTMDEKRTKEEYYKILQQAKISFSASLQETFGIGTVEALMLGAIPIVPYRLSYVELYERQFLYKDLYEARNKIRYFIKNYSKDHVQQAIKRNQEKIYRQSINAIPKMAKIMGWKNESW
jgi:hypothetical protein